MSLRRGHLRSAQWAPPTLRDDWRDHAKCAGMMNDLIPATVCDGCPVIVDCRLLYAELNELTMALPSPRRMPGTYGGVEHGAPKDHPLMGNPGGGRYPKGVQPVNGGACADVGCDRDAYRRGLCSMHYQRMMRERIGGDEDE